MSMSKETYPFFLFFEFHIDLTPMGELKKSHHFIMICNSNMPCDCAPLPWSLWGLPNGFQLVDGTIQLPHGLIASTSPMPFSKDPTKAKRLGSMESSLVQNLSLSNPQKSQSYAAEVWTTLPWCLEDVDCQVSGALIAAACQFSSSSAS